MNVQPSDIARTVAPYAAAGVGATVTVLERMTHSFVCAGTRYRFQPDTWIVVGWVPDERGQMQGPLLCVSDNCLRKVAGIEQGSSR